MTLDPSTAAKVSAELARVRLAGDRHGIDAALLALADDFEATQASDDTISLLLLTQAHQIAHLAEQLAQAYDIEVDDVFAHLGTIELRNSP
jgi:hypothetical protein